MLTLRSILMKNTINLFKREDEVSKNKQDQKEQ